MNDETLELLSAYLDGAVPPAERAALEARLLASPELRRELDELRAVAQAVKDLPKEPLPPGFISRFQARKAAGASPKADWVFLPPAARPIAFALSSAVVALVIWNKTTVAPEEPLLHPPGAANVSDMKGGPVAQLDFARRVSDDKAASATGAAVAQNAMGVSGAVSDPIHRDESTPSIAENAPAAAPAAAALSSLSAPTMAPKASMRRARALGSPLTDGAAASGGGGALAERGAAAMTEEERSAKNEQMFGYIESEKKKMGIAKVMPKDSLDTSRMFGGPAPAAPKIAAASPSLLKQVSQSVPAADALKAQEAANPLEGRLSPDAALVFTDARSLSSSWILLGFPGEPPTVDFTSGRLVLLKPSATKILSVTPKPNSVDVVYRSLTPEETPDPAVDRVAPIPSEPRTVLIFDASPR
jgi:hypothetical protein